MQWVRRFLGGALGHWCHVCFPLPDGCLLPVDFKGDGKGLCALHHHMCLWDAHFFAAEHWYYWHHDGEISNWDRLLFRVVLHPNAGSRQLRLCLPSRKRYEPSLLSGCIVLSVGPCLVCAQLRSPLASQCELLVGKSFLSVLRRLTILLVSRPPGIIDAGRGRCCIWVPLYPVNSELRWANWCRSIVGISARLQAAWGSFYRRASLGCFWALWNMLPP